MKDSRTHLDSITALRGLAALGVVLFHVRIFLWVGWNEIRGNPSKYSNWDHFASWFSIPTPFMGEGVLLFFVISGFCIHYPQSARKDKLNLRKYISRRFLRIYPPYAVTVGLSLLVIACYPWGNIMIEPVLPSLFLMQNYYPETNSQIGSNFSLWSIATEIEFYLAYPVLLLIWRKLGVVQSLNIFGAISVIAIGLYFYGIKSMAFCSLTFYIMWWAGAGLAELYVKGQLNRPSRSMIFLAIALLSTGVVTQIQGQNLVMIQRFLFGGFFLILIWWALSMGKSLNFRRTILGRTLLYLGRVSYSLYLIHYPMLQLIGYLWVDKFGSKPSNFFVPILFSIGSIFVASVFYKLVEEPSHKLAIYFGNKNK